MYKTDFLRQSVDMLLLVAKITSFHGLQEVFDTLMFLLCGFTGLLGDPPVREEGDERGSGREGEGGHGVLTWEIILRVAHAWGEEAETTGS